MVNVSPHTGGPNTTYISPARIGLVLGSVGIRVWSVGIRVVDTTRGGLCCGGI